MKKIRDYHVLETLNENDRSVTYRCQRGNDKPVIIKILNLELPTPAQIARFKYEYEQIKNINHPSIIKIHEIIVESNLYALVLEDFRGITLKNLITEHKGNLKTFFKIALTLAETLGFIHEKHIIHKDIKPDSILVGEDLRSIKLTDFGISAILTDDLNNLYRPDIIERTLSYISPEQTGRMNRNVDYRTDLYSLGVTFYELLTGNVPFVSSDPMELIHSHIARQPIPLVDINSNLPGILCDIVMKLLEKNAEDRYVNGYGLLADLKKCYESWVQSGTIKSFKLGTNDISMKYMRPVKLYGRDNELFMIHRAASKNFSGTKEILFVSGRPGIGKSALISEVHKPIIARRGYFISGKYDQLMQEVPYSSIIEAFTGLISQILTEPEDKIKIWKENITYALKANGQLIIDIIPKLELILGKQEPVSELNPEESQNRFIHVFKKFVGSLSSIEHPICFFLDDLQWIDQASAELLKNLLLSPAIEYLFFVGSYRDNDITSDHPVKKLIKTLKGHGIETTDMELGPLHLKDINYLVSDYLNESPRATEELSHVILQKTGGNPFFINQFMETIYSKKMLYFEPEKGWQWDNKEIKVMNVTENVVDLLLEKISELSIETQQVLQVGSCIGNQFRLETVAVVLEKTIDETYSGLEPALDEGYIIRSGDLFKFYHDRIQEACYSTIADEKKAKLHYRIGQKKLSGIKDESELDANIFEITDQLNCAAADIADNKERNTLIELNLKAGLKAKKSAAFDIGLRYLQTGFDLLPSDAWETLYDLTFNLHIEAAQCAYINARYDYIDTLLETLKEHTTDPIQKSRIIIIEIRSLVSQSELKKASEVGIAALEEFGVKIPEKPDKLYIARKLFTVKRLLHGKSASDILNLPPMTDPKKQAIINIANAVIPPTFISDKKLNAAIILEQNILSLKYGRNSNSASSLIAYAFLLTVIMGDIENGNAYGQIALELSEKYDTPYFQVNTKSMYYMFINHWKNDITRTSEKVIEIYREGVECGSIEYASFALLTYYTVNRKLTKSYTALVEHMESSIRELTGNTKFELLRHWIVIQMNHIIEYTGMEKPAILQEFISGEKLIPRFLEKNDFSSVMSHYLNKIVFGYELYEYDNAYLAFIKTRPYTNQFGGMISIASYHFFVCLVLLKRSNKLKGLKRYKILKDVRKRKKWLKKWAFHAPQNFSPNYYLVNAEYASVLNKPKKASRWYSLAINSAIEYNYPIYEALANELAAIHYKKQGNYDIYMMYIKHAYHIQHSLGAGKKLKAMKKRYSDVSFVKMDSTAAGSRAKKSVKESASILDLDSIIKSATTMLTELDLGKLLKKVLHIILENAGANRGFLILENPESSLLTIEAYTDTNGNTEVLQHINLTDSSELAVSIVNYVKKTGENVVLDDAYREGMFVSDSFIVRNQSRSLLCEPLKYQGKVSAILYLENTITANAFTRQRLEILHTISVQAAIAIENARLIMHREAAVRLSQEMKIAANIQTSLLPRSPAIHGYSIETYMKPADSVGGDYYDIINGKDRDWIIIGDVSGHGLSSGLVMMMVRTCIRYAVTADPEISPDTLLSQVNKTITESMGLLDEDKFMTISAFSIDKQGIVTYSGAHENIYIYRSKTGNIDTYKTSGCWLGIIPDISHVLTIDTFKIEPEDMMVLYTDGVTEAIHKKADVSKLKEKDFFGHSKLIEILNELGKEKPEKVKKAILSGLERDYITNDDVTMVILKRE